LKRKVLFLVGLVVVVGLGTAYAFSDTLFGGPPKTVKKTESVPMTAVTDEPEDQGQNLDEELSAVKENTDGQQTKGKKLSYYANYSVSKEEIKRDHQEAIQISEDRLKKKKLDIKPDLDDPKYRDFIKGMATDLTSYSKEEREQIIQYARDVDRYEDQMKNKRINELEKKLAAGEKLTGAELAELRDLLPNKKGNLPMTLDRSAKSGKEEVKGSPETVKGSEPKSQPKQETDQQESEGVSTQPAPADGSDQGTNPEQPATDDQQNATGGDQGQTTAPNQNNSESNQSEPNQGSADREQSSPDQSGTEPTREVPGSTAPNEQGNSNDGRTVQPQPGDDQNEGNAPSSSLIPYDRQAARDYAYQWWNKRNNEQYGYYSRVSGGCYNCWYDCTDFASQVMKAGGLVEWKETNYWYYSDKKPSYSWGVANSLYKHLKFRAKPVQSMFDLKIGDVVQADLDGDGDIDHSAVVTKVTPTEVYVTQHTTDKKDNPLSLWILYGFKVYGWDIQSANYAAPSSN
jgi:hypothetical protein